LLILYQRIDLLLQGSAGGRRVDSRLSLRRAIDDALVLRAALDRRPDVLMGHNVEGGVIAGLVGRWLACPVVYVRHSHFAEELAGASRWPGAARALGRIAEGLAERLATRIVALGRESDPDPRVDWIPPPFDPDERPMQRGNGRTLYYEGNLDPYQNLAWLDSALARVRQPDGRPVEHNGCLRPRKLRSRRGLYDRHRIRNDAGRPCDFLF